MLCIIVTYAFGNEEAKKLSKNKKILLAVGIISIVIFAFVYWYFNGLPRARGTLVIQSGTGGTTDPSPGTYDYVVGRVVTITAISDSGYNFSRWEPAGATGATSVENPINVTVQKGSATYEASFDLVNLLRNPSVEDDDDGDGEPDYWYLKEADIPTDQHIWSTDAHTGNRSLEIHITRNDTLSQTAFTGWRQKFDLEQPTNKSGYAPIERGKSYKLRGWGKTEGAELRIVVVIWDSNHTALVSAGSRVNSTTWTESQWANFTVPAEARYVAIGAVIMQKNIAPGFTTAWARADDFELVLAP